ncbi:MAG: DUF2169 domain-containing protein [Hydrogenophaga sp.]|nr:DUF2169 domain-containing protein [Hydrogenophaga sp.]
MNIHNHLPFVVDVRSTRDREGYELAALMVKATYNLPAQGELATVAAEQVPWAYADVLVGPEANPVSLYEAELSEEKVHPEYVVLGSAHSQDGKPRQHLPFGIGIGKHSKYLVAAGPRVWRSGWMGGRADDIAAVQSVQLSYGLSFGGLDPSRAERDDAWCEFNPVGTGYCADPDHRLADGMRMPQFEPMNQRFEKPVKDFPVLGLGPVARSSAPRAAWAGTYDEEWQHKVWPNLPADFDARFFQSTSQDQWLPAIQAGDEIVLKYLTAAQSRFGSVVKFQLPAMEFVATVHPRRGASTRVQLRPDTLVFEPDAGRFFVIARRTFALNESLLEIEAVSFGEPAQREQLAPIVPTFIDLEDLREQLRVARSPAGSLVNGGPKQ